MAWKTSNELLDDVYETLQRVRSKAIEIGQAKVEARLLDTGARLMLVGIPLAEGLRAGIKAA
jgi:hypothetical protein